VGGGFLLIIFIFSLAFGLVYAVSVLVLGKYESGRPSFSDPLVITSAASAFGAAGLAVMKGLEKNWLSSLIAALLFAGIASVFTFFAIAKKRK